MHALVIHRHFTLRKQLLTYVIQFVVTEDCFMNLRYKLVFATTSLKKVRVKVNLSLCLKYHAMKRIGGVDVYHHAFVTSSLCVKLF
jgi:hypothetical protein